MLGTLLGKQSATPVVKRKVAREVAPTGIERSFDENEVIVSKTDLTGHITYANDVFIRISDFDEAELLGAPHSILRHPDMPRAVFKLLWDTIQNGEEIFAYVVNMTKFGDHYWVFAHVTPNFDGDGKIVGYHSNRRKPREEPLARIQEIYKVLLAEERKHSDRKVGLQASYDLLVQELESRNMDYDAFIFSL